MDEFSRNRSSYGPGNWNFGKMDEFSGYRKNSGWFVQDFPIRTMTSDRDFQRQIWILAQNLSLKSQLSKKVKILGFRSSLKIFYFFHFLTKIWDSENGDDGRVQTKMLKLHLTSLWIIHDYSRRNKNGKFRKKIEKFQFLFYHLESHNYITGDITGLIEKIIHHVHNTIWFSKNSGTSEIKIHNLTK